MTVGPEVRGTSTPAVPEVGRCSEVGGAGRSAVPGDVVSSGDGEPRDRGEILAELRTARAVLAARLATLDKLFQETTRRVHHGQSGDGAVLARVDGNGRLLTLAVDPGAVRAPHPERVGPQIVAAVTAARGAAARERQRRTREMLG